LLASNIEVAGGNDLAKFTDAGFDVYGGLFSLWTLPALPTTFPSYGKLSC
jgi:hypothetical protein